MDNVANCSSGAMRAATIPAPSIEQGLHAWAAGGPPREGAARAFIVERILAWQGDNAGRAPEATTPLDLSLEAAQRCDDGYSWPLRPDQYELSSLPAEIGELHNLTQLDLSGARLTNLPEEIGNLAHLTHLDLSGNWLPSLRPEIGNLTHLTFLDLNGNVLRELPPEIGHLTHLSDLSLNNNHLAALPWQIGNLTNLTHLDLFGNRLAELPPEFGNLRSLDSLDLTDNPLLTVPPEFGNLANLTVLSLSECPLTDLPPAFGNLTRLIQANLSNLQLRAIPRAFGNLVNLTHLDLSGCRLSALPREFSNLTNLRYLDLRRTRITEERRQLITRNMARLTELHLSDTPFRPMAPNSGPSENLARYGTTPDELSLDDQRQPIEHAPSFFAWLERMATTQDYLNASHRPALESQLGGLIQDLRADESLRRTCFAIADEAVTSCDDRIALALNDMHLAAINARAVRDEIDAPTLVALGRSMFAMELVNRHARDAIAALPGREDIEVMLHFQTALRERFDLPVQTQGMLYRGVSGVTDADITLAENRILDTLTDGHSLKDFLLSWPPLHSFIERMHAATFGQLESTFHEQLNDIGEQLAAGAMNETDYLARSNQIMQERLNARRELATTLLDNLLPDSLAAPTPPLDPSKPPAR